MSVLLLTAQPTTGSGSVGNPGHCLHSFFWDNCAKGVWGPPRVTNGQGALAIFLFRHLTRDCLTCTACEHTEVTDLPPLCSQAWQALGRPDSRPHPRFSTSKQTSEKAPLSCPARQSTGWPQQGPTVVLVLPSPHMAPGNSAPVEYAQAPAGPAAPLASPPPGKLPQDERGTGGGCHTKPIYIPARAFCVGYNAARFAEVDMVPCTL